MCSGVGVIEEGLVPKHRTDDGYVAVVQYVGSFSWMMHRKVVEGHVAFANYLKDVRVKTEVFRCKLVYLIVSEDGCGRIKC